MIVPGLDRIDGTAVNGELLDNDDLWHEHTTEIMELLELENRGRPDDERISMIQFCAPYANGSKFTRAMKRAQVRKEWFIDKAAVRLKAKEDKATKSVSNRDEEQLGVGRKRRGKRSNVVKITRDGTSAFHANKPGLLYAFGGAYPYDEENQEFRKALKRFRTMMIPEGFHVTADHACHVTVAVLQSYSADASDDTGALLEPNVVINKLQKSSRINAEIAKGPFDLVVDRIEIPTGDTIIILFKDDTERLKALRSAVREELATVATGLKIPSIIHSSIARVVSPPACSRDIMLQRMRGIFEGLKIRINTLDLVLEDRDPYFTLFPDGSLAHWELLDHALLYNTESIEDDTSWNWLSFKGFEVDATAKVSILFLALSFVSLWWTHPLTQEVI
jgi:hypothetical protein